jgi:hypothetical protein
VPTDRATEITLVLIRQVNRTYSELMKNADLINVCQKVAPFLLKSVMHPSVTDLDAIPSVTHPNLMDYYKVENCDLLYNALPLLQGLKAVRLGEANRSGNMILDVEGFRDTLETFSSRSSWDSDIETLAKNCKKLRCLDISSSEDISDGVVDHILKFQKLEELNLCEIDTLSHKALQDILNGFAEVEFSGSEDCWTEFKIPPSPDKETPEDGGFPSKILRSQLLKNFGCSKATKQHIALISQKFPNLTSLSLSNIHTCMLTPLRNLQQLRAFTLIDSTFFLVEDFLQAAGSQLTCLDFVDVNGTDFNFICEKCPSLVCLHLCFDSIKNIQIYPKYNEGEPENNHVPNIQSVKFLQLFLREYCDADYILKCFRNLRKLFMGSTRYGGNLLEEILRRKYLIHLEELFLGNQVVVKFFGSVIYATRFNANGKISHIVHELQN